eukprot:CAMPEP_0198288544 /NCGR_PEP_ID=MMETSP1449-20131203/7009_1 /TAXON_ID=420275 /ORGANISM="Attheya septentrionalis, Strain CCMP2084" /LENGTH=304 /DNA_ID=CAMNT_0043986705 /DNA_START=31 /DNA_END=945 /DNA_ORIENTATION=-
MVKPSVRQGRIVRHGMTKPITGVAVALLFLIALLVLSNNNTQQTPGASLFFAKETSSQSARGLLAGEERCDRLIQIEAAWKRMQSVRSFETMKCENPIGKRPSDHLEEIIGNPCEPWQVRGAIFALGRLLDSSMNGLEWSSGSSTRFYLLYVKSLFTIEHDGQYFDEVNASLRGMMAKMGLADQALTYKLIPPSKPYSDADGGDGTLEEFEDYVHAKLSRDSYDLISVDGRARVPCLRRALKLIQPQNGIILLDNSDRFPEAHRMVPSHWTKVNFSSDVVDSKTSTWSTTIWCSRKQQETEAST